MTHIGSYILILLFISLFLVFISGDIGWALIYIVGGIIIISLALILLSKNRFSARITELSGTANVGERVEFEITLEKTGFCILPYAEICVQAESVICLRTSLIFRNSVKMKGSFRTAHSGLNKIKLTGVTIRDFAGLVQFEIPFNTETQKGVLPREIEYNGPEIIPSVLPDDSGESEEGQSVIRGGMPGYEHREYVAGDSLRRVDYKLSAKKRKLMVRLDESTGFAATNLYISENALPVCCDLAFALAKSLIMRGGTVKITHKNESITAATPETLGIMREWLAFREYNSPNPTAAAENVEHKYSVPEDANVIFSGTGEIAVRSAAA